MECAIQKSIHRKVQAVAVNLIAHDFLAEANRPRRAVFAARFGREEPKSICAENHSISSRNSLVEKRITDIL